jgi:hypothetical protein
MVVRVIQIARLLIILASDIEVVFENLALRQQWRYCRTRRSRPFRWSDRLFWVASGWRPG